MLCQMRAPHRGVVTIAQGKRSAALGFGSSQECAPCKGAVHHRKNCRIAVPEIGESWTAACTAPPRGADAFPNSPSRSHSSLLGYWHIAPSGHLALAVQALHVAGSHSGPLRRGALRVPGTCRAGIAYNGRLKC